MANFLNILQSMSTIKIVISIIIVKINIKVEVLPSIYVTW